MSSPTTLKLPEQLKRRVGPLARLAGKTPHAWMIEAIEAQATLAERHATFVADALGAAREAQEKGIAYPADQVHRYVRTRAAGRRAQRPKPMPW